MKAGLIVNPVAGMGGRVGLKGTDGASLNEARRRGAIPSAGEKARRALGILARRLPGAAIEVALGPSGSHWLEGLPLAPRIFDAGPSTGSVRDTTAAAGHLVDRGCDLIVFAGGDGTARDILGSIPRDTAILGIPCGVKMHSATFAVSPEAAGAIWADLLAQPGNVAWNEEAEVVDIDEDDLRLGRLSPRIFGHAKVPVTRVRMQAAKGGPRRDEGALLLSAASDVVREMEADTLYLVGPGRSAGSVLTAMGHEPTLLGVDAVRGGRLLARDANADELEGLAGDGPTRIVLGVTGRQGFLLGRGNQQIGPGLIARAGREGLIVLASESKLLSLAQPALWIDTGDPDLDRRLQGYIPVRTGAGRCMMMRVQGVF